ARRAGYDRGLAFDAEQRQRVFQEIFGHFVTRKSGTALSTSWPGLSRPSTTWRHRKAWMPGTRPGMTAEYVAATSHHAGGDATATKIVHTSLVRLMISRLSFGPM